MASIEIPLKETTDALVYKSTALLPEIQSERISTRSKSMTYINRPWMQSFGFETIPFSDKRIEQFHKLTRNFVASLDLGCPSAKHVPVVEGNVRVEGLTDRERYLLWVKGWKQIYRELSSIIRLLKQSRKTVHFPTLTNRQKDLFVTVAGSQGMGSAEYLRWMACKHLERLQESAMVLLNARYNAKLAAAERRRRLLAEA